MMKLLPGIVIDRPGSSVEYLTSGWRYLLPVRERGASPCVLACPVGNDWPTIFYLLEKGRLREAWETLKRTAPLPSVCGRVCHRPCESSCNRKEFDEALSMREVERFLGDLGRKRGWRVEAGKPTGRRVAVVGSGPAGLSCAYQLRLRGHEVTVFESLPLAGGMLVAGIPPFRLPREVVGEEIKALEALGVEIKVNHPVRSLEELKGYEAVFLATGAMKSTKLGVPGEEAEGVLPGMDFLREVNLGRKVRVGKRVLVIGGGNTAIDCARVSLRLGATVTILYRRSKEEMPATEEEVEEALSEGVRIEFLVAPKRVLTEGGKVVGLECLRMRLGEPDASGRRRPVPIEGSEFRAEADTVIAAIGQEPDLSYLPKEVQTERGYIRADEFGRTSLPGVFAGGDVVWGAVERVSEAIGWGRRVAESIDAYLRGESPSPPQKPREVKVEELKLDYFSPSPRVRVPGPESVEEARKEAGRCFSCGTCNGCDNCWILCPEGCIVKEGEKEYRTDEDYCKGCGICAVECPRVVIRMEEGG